jgi:hypothetical protein
MKPKIKYKAKAAVVKSTCFKNHVNKVIHTFTFLRNFRKLRCKVTGSIVYVLCSTELNESNVICTF